MWKTLNRTPRRLPRAGAHAIAADVSASQRVSRHSCKHAWDRAISACSQYEDVRPFPIHQQQECVTDTRQGACARPPRLPTTDRVWRIKEQLNCFQEASSAFQVSESVCFACSGNIKPRPRLRDPSVWRSDFPAK